MISNKKKIRQYNIKSYKKDPDKNKRNEIRNSYKQEEKDVER